jgi:hypothetical protein
VKTITIVAVLSLALCSACRGGSSSPSTVTVSIGGVMASCSGAPAAQAEIKKLFGQVAKPTVDILAGPSAITSKAQIAEDKVFVQHVIDVFTADIQKYQPCLGDAWAKDLQRNVDSLRTYV